VVDFLLLVLVAPVRGDELTPGVMMMGRGARKAEATVERDNAKASSIFIVNEQIVSYLPVSLLIDRLSCTVDSSFQVEAKTQVELLG